MIDPSARPDKKPTVIDRESAGAIYWPLTICSKATPLGEIWAGFLFEPYIIEQFSKFAQVRAVDLEAKLIGHRQYGTDSPKPFEGSPRGPYVVTVRAGKVLFMYKDRMTETADGFSVKDVERMIEGNCWGIMAK